MSYKRRGIIYACLGFAGLALAAYVLRTLLRWGAQPHGTQALVFYGLCGIGVLLAGLVNFYTAYAYLFGRVDQVVGTVDRAALLRDGRAIRPHARLYLVRHVDADNLSLPAEQQCVIFICGGRPWSCPASGFHLSPRA